MEAISTTENSTNNDKVQINKCELNVNETKNVNDDNINVNETNTKVIDGNWPTKHLDIENVDAIKKYIEQQEKEIEELKAEGLKSKLPVAKEDSPPTPMSLNVEQTLSMSSTVIDNMMIESELDSAKKEEKPKTLFSSIDKGSIALSVGSRVEAMDFCGDWYRADIIEVDFEEMEVLVHYEMDTKKLDEWISVSSSRLRPEGTAPTVKPGPSSSESLSDTIPISAIKEEIKEQKERAEEKAKLTYTVGERCLARWRDNRRFVATVLKDVGDDNYEIVFDDGCHWKCKASRLYKMKPDKGVASEAASPLGPSNAPAPLPAYHTHLFDPARDYLGSKSERRERKRKLNIKEIFNIGQKKKKTQRRKPKVKKIKTEVVQEFPGGAVDAVASIIGSVNTEHLEEPKLEIKSEPDDNTSIDENTEIIEVPLTACDSDDEADNRMDLDTVLEEESKLEKFEKPENHHEEVIDRIKEAITKLEDGIIQAERMNSPKLDKVELEKAPIQVIEEKPIPDIQDTKESINEPVIDESTEKIEQITENTEPPEVQKEEIVEDSNKEKVENIEPDKMQDADTKTDMKDLSIVLEKMKDLPPTQDNSSSITQNPTKTDTKHLAKVKKSKKLRLIREKKVKKQVAKVKSELEAMKRQVEEMRKQMLMKSQDSGDGLMPESFLLPGEWCCKWMNGQPVGKVSEIESDVKPDPASGKVPLPRRSVEVEDKRLPEGWTKHMVRRSFGNSAGKWDVVLVSPDNRRFHTKHEMRIYLENHPSLQPYQNCLLDFGIHLKLSRRMGWITRTSDGETIGPTSLLNYSTSPLVKRKSLSLKKKLLKKSKKKIRVGMEVPEEVFPMDTDVDANAPPLEDGYVYCGSLKVQIIETLLRCPAEGCLKNFRNTTLLKMHIKHYHRELHKMMGVTPKVLDLAYARTKIAKPPKTKSDKSIKVKISRPKQERLEPKEKEIRPEMEPTIPYTENIRCIPRSQDSPKLRKVLSKPVKRPKVLLPFSRADPNQVTPDLEFEEDSEPFDIPMENVDFETAISTHTVTKPLFDKKLKKKCFASVKTSEEDEWMGISSDVDSRSFPGSGTPDSKVDIKPAPPEFTEDKDMYTYTENGERIKIVHMKREEIINCHCGFREEDGLMVQCELCLCWQHALCHNIQKEGDVPEKYTCSICLNPRRGRRSKRFVHDQDRLYEGLLPAAKPCESLRRSHELTGNLLRIEDALHALRVKYYVATKKDHPKLYLWARDWEQVEIQYTQEKLNSDYSDLNIMINSIGKENLPLKSDDMLDIRTPPSEELEQDRYTHREGPLGSQALLSSILSSPGGTSLDLPISTSELERLAKSVQEQELERQIIMAPQPEAAIEDGACRERLLRHLTRCQALVDARLDSIEAQVAELESQDPSLQDDETADFYPRTKQTIQMLMRDLDTMEELGVIT